VSVSMVGMWLEIHILQPLHYSLDQLFHSFVYDELVNTE